jgi:hypothetical protein
MNAYIGYKEWWIDTQAPHGTYSQRDQTSEEIFADHVNELGLYELMERLVDWNEEQ